MATNVNKISKKALHPTATWYALNQSRELVKLILDTAFTVDAPASFTQPLADAIRGLETAMAICDSHVIK